MLDDAVLGTAVAVNLIAIVAGLFADDHTVATHSKAVARRQAGESRLDLTRLRATILVADIVVVTLFSRHLDAIATESNTHASLVVGL